MMLISLESIVMENSCKPSSILGCKVIMCDFHREQAWDRWLSKGTNNVRPHKEAILAHLRKVAKAESIEEFEMAEENLKASDFWNANYGSKLREWFENTWLEEKEVSSFVFCPTDTVFSIEVVYLRIWAGYYTP